MTGALYLYGIAGGAGSLALPEVHGLAGKVSVMAHGGLGAIVGAPPEGDLQELSREKAVRLLSGHQQVLEAAMAKATVLPVKFGTVSPSESAVRSLLRQSRDILLGLLAEFSGCAQIEIAALWKPELVLAEIASGPDIAEAQRQARHGRNEEAAVKFTLSVKAALERRRAVIQARIEEAVRLLAMDIAFKAPADDRMAANCAVLIGHADAGPLKAAIDALDSEFGGRLTFRCTGPLPPASFATLQVVFPCAQSIARARQALDLEGPITQKSIASAFMRRARENHPDLSTGEAAGRLDELTKAYRLLLACVKSRHHPSPGKDPDEPVLLEIDGHRSDVTAAWRKSVA